MDFLKNGGWRARIHRPWDTDLYSLDMFRYRFNGRELRSEYLVIPQLELKDFEEGDRFPAGFPTMRLDRDQMAALALGLEEAGVFAPRPPETAKLEGSLEATKAHLEDMRRLVLGKKK